MKLRLGLLLGVLVLGAAAVVAVATPSADAKTGGALAVPGDGIVKGTGASIAGTFTINKFKVVDGALTAVGTYRNAATSETTPASAQVTKINGTAVGAASSGLAAQAASSCQILDLTLGPLHLDLLGLVVDLNQVNLRITAEPGQGNLLGNLLCQVAGLLDNNPGGGGLSGLLQSIANLLNQILGQLQL